MMATFKRGVLAEMSAPNLVKCTLQKNHASDSETSKPPVTHINTARAR